MPNVVRLAVAAAGLSLVVFLLLLCGVANRLTLGMAGGACLALGWRPRGWPPLPRSWLLAPLGLFGAWYLVHALAPEIQPDGYTYHLGLVAEWLRLGGFANRVGFHEMLPQGLETLFVIGYAYLGGSGAKLVHFAFLAATPALLLALGRRLGLEDWRAAAAGVLYFCAPVVGISGTSAYNDAALAFTTLATFYLLVAWWQDDDSRLLLPLGVVAGFCYAIKMTGAVVAPAVVIAVAARRRFRAAGLVALGAALLMAPWMIRNAAMAGNPAAPWLNRLFPNQWFHASVEEELTRYYRGHHLDRAALPLELTVRGFHLQGILGPIFLLSPLSLLAARRREGGAVLLAAAAAATPWLANVGTRFLIPGLPLIALALAMVLPRPALCGVAALHALSASPWALSYYESPGAWRLRGFPWRAALRLESERDYLRRELFEYRVAELMQAKVAGGRRVLDLFGAPAAYIHALAVAPWQSASAGRATDALRTATLSGRGMFQTTEFRWPTSPLTGLRFRQTARDEAYWSLQELQLSREQETLRPSRQWRVEAWPNPWEAPLAFDRNPASRWCSWQPMRPGMFVEVDFGRPEQVDEARLVGPRSERAARIELYGRGPDGVWRLIPAVGQRSPVAPRSWRRQAVHLVLREGFGWVLAKVGDDGYGPLSRELVDHAGDWGIQIAGNVESVYLLRVM